MTTFDRHGWPINPLTDKAYSREEIVTDQTLPYPHHVNPAQPGDYWRRRTAQELAAAKKQAARKATQRAQRQNNRRSKRLVAASLPFDLSGAELQRFDVGQAMATLVSRVNQKTREI